MCVFHRSSAVLSLFMYASLCLGLFTSLLIILFYFGEISHIQLRLLEFLLLKDFFFLTTGPFVIRDNL